MHDAPVTAHRALLAVLILAIPVAACSGALDDGEHREDRDHGRANESAATAETAAAHDDAPPLAASDEAPPEEGTTKLRELPARSNYESATTEMVRFEDGVWTAPFAEGDGEIGEARIPWIDGRMLVPVFGPSITGPAFAVIGAPGAPAPDFGALDVRSWITHAPHGEYEAAPAYATVAGDDGTELLVLDSAERPRRGRDPRSVGYGVYRWSEPRGASFTKLPIAREKTYGAFVPHAIVANRADDVWVGASVVSEPFDDDFPGCPSIVYASLDGTYLAHWDGRRWSEVAFPGNGRLWDLALDAEGNLVVTTGWAAAPMGMTDAPLPPQQVWTYDGDHFRRTALLPVATASDVQGK